MNRTVSISVCAAIGATLALTDLVWAQGQGVDEITVTARKREETLLEVPTSATVLTADSVKDLIIDDTDDLLRQLPAAIGTTTGPEENGDIVFRGQGAGRLGDATESATGIYRNGIFVAGGSFGGRTFNRLDLFDFQRVEALRGPQGALYGRNAVGGAINIVSTRPQDEFGFSGEVGYRFENDELDLEGVVNLPVSDNLALRVGGFRYHQDGYIDLVGTDVDVDERTFEGIRGAGRLKNFWGDAVIDLTLEYYAADVPSQGSTGFSVSAGDPDFFTRDNLDSFGRTDIEDKRVMLEFEKGFGFADLTIATVYTKRNGDRLNEDLDHFNAALGPASEALNNVTADYERIGAEVRLASADTSSRWTWLIGLDAQQSEEEIGRSQSRLIGGNRVVPRDEAFEETFVSASIFGSVGYDLTEKLNLTVEARAQYDDKEIDGITNVSLAAGGGVTVPAGTTFQLDDVFSGFTPVASLRYQVTPDHATYLRFATGYRAGGFNQASIVRANTPVSYDREYAYSTEIGWKGRLFDNRLQFEVAAFYTFTDDVQVVSRVDSGIGVFVLQNAGDQDLYGVEFDMRGRQPIGAGVLRGTLGVAYTNGDFREGTEIVDGPGGFLLDISGNRVNRTRDYTVNLNLSYDHPIGNTGLDFIVSGSAQFEGGGYENAKNDQTLDHFALFDARVAIAAEHWRLSVFGKNLSDDIYVREALSGNLFLNSPQTFGVEFSFDF